MEVLRPRMVEKRGVNIFRIGEQTQASRYIVAAARKVRIEADAPGAADAAVVLLRELARSVNGDSRCLTRAHSCACAHVPEWLNIDGVAAPSCAWEHTYTHY